MLWGSLFIFGTAPRLPRGKSGHQSFIFKYLVLNIPIRDLRKLKIFKYSLVIFYRIVRGSHSLPISIFASSFPTVWSSQLKHVLIVSVENPAVYLQIRNAGSMANVPASWIISRRLTLKKIAFNFARWPLDVDGLLTTLTQEQIQ